MVREHDPLAPCLRLQENCRSFCDIGNTGGAESRDWRFGKHQQLGNQTSDALHLSFRELEERRHEFLIVEPLRRKLEKGLDRHQRVSDFVRDPRR